MMNVSNRRRVAFNLRKIVSEVVHSPQVPMRRHAVRSSPAAAAIAFAVVFTAVVAAARPILHAAVRILFAFAALEVALSAATHPELAREIFAALCHARCVARLDCEDSTAVTTLNIDARTHTGQVNMTLEHLHVSHAFLCSLGNECSAPTWRPSPSTTQLVEFVLHAAGGGGGGGCTGPGKGLPSAGAPYPQSSGPYAH